MKTRLLIYIVALVGLLSCAKIDIPETDGTFVVQEQLTGSVDLRRALVYRLYDNWHGFFNATTAANNFSAQLGLYADEFQLAVPSAARTLQTYENAFVPNTSGLYFDPWAYLESFYQLANAAGQLLDVYTDMGALSGQEAHQRGEAHLFIAMSYQYAKVLYGELPVLTDPKDFNGNFTKARQPLEQVNAHIASQARLALEYLQDGRFDFELNPAASGPTFRMNRDVALQFLSDFYLESGKPDSAIYFADLIIGNYPLESNPGNTFLTASSETIWAMQPMVQTYSTAGANLYNLTNQPSLNSQRPVVFSAAFLTQLADHDRRWGWVGRMDIGSFGEVHFSTKYSTLTFNANPIDPNVMFRSSKAHFNKVEALLQLNQPQQAYEAFLPLWNKNHSEPLDFADFNLDLVINERWVEFATEHGDRWFTLRRYPEKLKEVMTVATAQKSQGTSQWEDYKRYLPIPANIIQYSPYFRQNPGYVGY